jgi:hypothetical protein
MNGLALLGSTAKFLVTRHTSVSENWSCQYPHSRFTIFCLLVIRYICQVRWTFSFMCLEGAQVGCVRNAYLLNEIESDLYHKHAWRYQTNDSLFVDCLRCSELEGCPWHISNDCGQESG